MLVSKSARETRIPPLANLYSQSGGEPTMNDAKAQISTACSWFSSSLSMLTFSVAPVAHNRSTAPELPPITLVIESKTAA